MRCRRQRKNTVIATLDAGGDWKRKKTKRWRMGRHVVVQNHTNLFFVTMKGRGSVCSAWSTGMG